MLKLEIVSSRTVDGNQNEKKYVAYMLQVKQDNTKADPNPVNVERRYTDFLVLYNGLKKDFPTLVANIVFPKKVMMGNFDPIMISERCNGFEALLKTISSDSRLRDAPAFVKFLQEVEMLEAQKLLAENKYDQALSLLETSFRLLNKVYTDRSSVVLCALCRIVACASVGGGCLAAPVERWAHLALRRYEAVSDSDLLQLYVPLLHTAIGIWDILGRDKSKLVQELNDLRKRGMKVDNTPSLSAAIETLENI